MIELTINFAFKFLHILGLMLGAAAGFGSMAVARQARRGGTPCWKPRCAGWGSNLLTPVRVSRRKREILNLRHSRACLEQFPLSADRAFSSPLIPADAGIQ